MHNLWSKHSGFTIVELLIVIVVIGILAAITIVAYNGIQGRARVATVQSDLEGAAKQLAMDQVTTSVYPAMVALANNGAGLKASTGTTYQYAVNNTVNPQTFCITATNSTTSYFVSNTNNIPTSGACPGQGANGVAPTTNLVVNPSFETNTTGWSPSGSSIALDSSWSSVGTNSMRITASTNTTGAFSPTFPATAGLPYSFSYAYNARTLSTGNQFIARFVWWDSNNVAISTTGNWIFIGAGIGVSKDQNEIAPTGATHGALQYFSGGSTNTVDVSIDAVMVVQASSIGNYADGNSPNWVWNGTLNNSTSTGPAL